VLIINAPLAPDAPLFAVEMSKLPLPAAVLAPLASEMSPPFDSPADPAVAVIDPPLVSPAPPRRLMPPAAPPAALPEAIESTGRSTSRGRNADRATGAAGRAGATGQAHAATGFS
jgi:hypothetical protein